MAVESPSDLAGMFDEAEFAEPARYTAPGGGTATACSVIVDRGQGRSAFDAGRVSAEGANRLLWVRKAELVTVARSGLFEMLDDEGAPTGETFAVAGEPELDETAALWTCELLIGD